jgi:hypothetical protein
MKSYFVSLREWPLAFNYCHDNIYNKEIVGIREETDAADHWSG